MRLPAPEPIHSPRLEKSLADIDPYLTVDIGTFAWYKAGILGGAKLLILLLLNGPRDNPPLGTNNNSFCARSSRADSELRLVGKHSRSSPRGERVSLTDAVVST
jgi:hypothetical protein